MNDTSSPYDRFQYECKTDIGDEYSFVPVGGINPLEWGNVADMARALEYLRFCRGVSLKEIRTVKGYYEKDLDSAFEYLTSALTKGVIEVDERRKMRMSNGYGNTVREKKADEALLHRTVQEIKAGSKAVDLPKKKGKAK